MIPELSKHFYVLAPDLPGFGQSDKPQNAKYDLSFFRGFILDFYDTLNLKTASLTAHDLGGMAGLSFAVRHPDRLDKFIIMDTSPYPKWSFMLHLSIYMLKRKYLTPLFLNRFVFKQVLKSGFYNKKFITPDVLEFFRVPWVSSLEGRRAFCKTIEAPPSEMVEPKEALGKIKSDTLILWGKNDFFFPYKIAQRLHKDIKKSTLVGVDQAGHFLQEEQPEFICQQIISFLKD
jgi:pimeloyl-ACP methyl ester carboxylesterase